MNLYLAINFETDGDFIFADLEEIFDEGNPMYSGAEIHYYVDNTTYSDGIKFSMKASGAPNACRWAARDLMESIVCHLRTMNYEIIKDVYDLVITPKEEYLWSDADVHYLDCLGGNYAGSYISMTVEH